AQNLRRLERLLDELHRIRRPANDVDLLVVELAHDVLHASTTHADTGADRVNLVVRTVHRDLRAGAGLAGDGPARHGAVGNLTDLHLDQAPARIRMAARKNALRPPGALLHRDDIGSKTITDAVFLGRNALPRRHHGLQ